MKEGLWVRNVGHHGAVGRYLYKGLQVTGEALPRTLRQRPRTPQALGGPEGNEDM